MGTKWREQKNSPDWTDVFSVVRAIEELHSVQVFITLTATTFAGPAGFTTVAAHNVAKHGEASVLGEPAIVLCGEWPCPNHKDYVSCLYSALLTLDNRLGAELWKQMKLPFTAETPRA